MNLSHVHQLLQTFATWFDQALQRAEGFAPTPSSESSRNH